MKKLFASYTVAILITIFLSVNISAQYFDKSEYKSRRSKLMKKIPDGIAIILGAQLTTDYKTYFQNNDFMYFSGVEIPNSVLVIDGKNKESALFFTETERGARNEGINVELIHNPKEVTGIEKIFKYDELSDYLNKKSKEVKTLYTSFRPEELMRECTMEKLYKLRRFVTQNPWDGRLTRELQFIENLKKKCPKTEIKDCSEMIWDLRIIKSAAEIELMRKAGKIGVKAHIELMKATKPGKKEYELAALFEYICKKQGAQDLAYYTIICSAENHPYLHYHKYDRVLQDGDFLVIDGGPDYHYYDIDITISYPANGKFTARQKEIYEATNAMHEACMKVYRPGITTKQADKEVEKILIKQGYDLSSDIFRKLRAGFGHYVGMAVHDVGRSPSVLKAGMVFANEPLAVFEKENLGVRVEDTILITEDGCENLTAGLPRTVEEIEALMKSN